MRVRSEARRVQRALHVSCSPSEAGLVSRALRRGQQVARNHERAGARCVVHRCCDSAALTSSTRERACARLERRRERRVAQQLVQCGSAEPRAPVGPDAKEVPVCRQRRDDGDDHQGDRDAERCPARNIPLSVQLTAVFGELREVRSHCRAVCSRRVQHDAGARGGWYAAHDHLFVAHVAQQRSGRSIRRSRVGSRVGCEPGELASCASLPRVARTASSRASCRSPPAQPRATASAPSWWPGRAAAT